jgi:hypothetical protein
MNRTTTLRSPHSRNRYDVVIAPTRPILRRASASQFPSRPGRYPGLIFLAASPILRLAMAQAFAALRRLALTL